MNVLFAGLHEGRKVSCANTNDKSEFNDQLYCTVFGLLKNGETSGAEFFLKTVSAERVNTFSTLTTDGETAFSSGKFSKSEGGIPIDSVVLSFFSLDDIVFMRSVQGNGLQRLTAYVLLSFHAFSFHDREITYTSNFVIPLSLKTRGKEYQTDFLCRLDNLDKCDKSYSEKIKKEVAKTRKKVKKYLGGYFRTALKIIKKGQRFDKTLDNVDDGVREGDVGHFTVRMNIDVDNYRTQDQKVEMKKLSDFASVMASAQLSKAVMIVPSYVSTDRTLPLASRDESERVLRSIVLNSRTSLAKLTKTTVTGKKDSGKGTICGFNGVKNRYTICENIFPEIDAAYKMDLSLARQSSGTKGNFKLDTLTSRLTVSVFELEDESKCTVGGKAHTKMQYDYKDKYAQSGDVRRGEAGFYNVVFNLFKKVFSKKAMLGEC